MAVAKILKKRIKYFNKYGGSGMLYYTVRCRHTPTDDDLAAIGLRPLFCSCSHDCCGHAQIGPPWVARRNKRNEWFVTQHWYYNI